MAKVLGQSVLQQAEKEVKKKVSESSCTIYLIHNLKICFEIDNDFNLQKSKPRNIIKLCQEPETEEKQKPKYSLEDDDSERGVICLSHIPHGFYEEQIKNFFKQFGKVLKVRVARSKRVSFSYYAKK